MSQYIILNHVQVKNANSIAGLTWGFPAITQFLGFSHALNRKLSNQYDGFYDINLTGCAVISNEVNNKVYQPKKYADFEFLQSKNPPVLAIHKNSSPPIIEEGKVNLTVSLVIEIESPLLMTKEKLHQLENDIYSECCHMKLAGGTILNIKAVKVVSGDTEDEHKKMLRNIKRLVMPGFVLLDRRQFLQEHFQAIEGKKPDASLFEAWLDFSALEFQVAPSFNNYQENADNDKDIPWEYKAKPKSGYLVPLMTGYKAISEIYEPDEILNTRDINTPALFVEAIHSVGEWKGAHSISSIANVIWRYQHDGQWYLCTQDNKTEEKDENIELTLSKPESDSLSDVLNLL